MSGSKSEKVKKTAEEKKLEEIAAEAYSISRKTYDPIVNKFIAKAKDGTEVIGDATGRAAAATEDAFGEVIEGTANLDMTRGAAPGSGAFAGDLGDQIINKTRSKGLGVGDARKAGKDVQLSRLNQVINYGQGRATEAVSGIGDVARVAQNQALSDAEFAANQRAQLIGAGASAVGGYYGWKAGQPAPTPPPPRT